MPFVLDTHLLPSLESAERELEGAFGVGWRARRADILEVVVVTKDSASTSEETEAVEAAYALMNELYDRKFRPTFGSGTTGSRVRARYRELRKEGLHHLDAITEMLKVIKWCKRTWWSDPTMRPYCKPDSIFRKTKFHERRT